MTRQERALASRRNPDGGVGPVPGATSEPEPTALFALALDDADARGWLEARPLDDGGFGSVVGAVESDRTGLVALALPEGDVRDRALDELVGVHAIGGVAGGPVPHDPTVTGWGWTHGAFGWVEPTAWGLLALRRLRPAATDRIDDAVAMLADRECVEGGWNYGNRLVFDVALPPYVQTTAMALLGLRGLGPERTERGLAALADRWRGEMGGRLSLATACAALRAYEHPDASSAAVALRGREDDDGADTISLAWTVLAIGDGLERVMAP